MIDFALSRASSPAEASEQAAKSKTAQQGAQVRYVAGGTTLIDLMKLDVETPVRVIDINRLELARTERQPDGSLRIGAMVRNADLAHDPNVVRDYPVLSQALLSGATGQLRNMATTGGQSAATNALQLLPGSGVRGMQQAHAGLRLCRDRRTQSHARHSGHERALYCHASFRHGGGHDGAGSAHSHIERSKRTRGADR